MSISWDDYNRALGRPIGTTTPQPQQNISLEAYNAALGRPINQPLPQQYIPPQQSQQQQQHISLEAYNAALRRPVNQLPPQLQPSPVPSMSWEAYNRALGRSPDWRTGMPMPPVPQTPPPSISWELYNQALGRDVNYRPPGQIVQQNNLPSPVPSMSWEAYNRALGRSPDWRTGMPMPPVPQTPPPSISWELYNQALGRNVNYRPPGQIVQPNQPVQPTPLPNNQTLPINSQPTISWQDYNTALGRPFSWRPGMPIPQNPYSPNDPPPQSISWSKYNIILGRPESFRPPGFVEPISVSPIPSLSWEVYNAATGKPIYYRPGMGNIPNVSGYSPDILPVGINWDQFNLALGRHQTYRPIQKDYAESIFEIEKKKQQTIMGTDPTYADPTQWIEKLLGFVPVVGGALSFVSWFAMAFFYPGEGISIEDYVRQEIEASQNANAMANVKSFINVNHELGNARAIYEKYGSTSKDGSELETFKTRLEIFLTQGSLLTNTLITLKMYKPLAIIAFVHLTNLVEVILYGEKWKYHREHIIDFRARLWQEAENVTNTLYHHKFDNLGDATFSGRTMESYNYMKSTVSSLLLFRKEYSNIGKQLDTAPQSTFFRKDIKYPEAPSVNQRNSLFLVDPESMGVTNGVFFDDPDGTRFENKKEVPTPRNVTRVSFYGVSNKMVMVNPTRGYSTVPNTNNIDLNNIQGASIQLRILLSFKTTPAPIYAYFAIQGAQNTRTRYTLDPIISLGDDSMRVVVSPSFIVPTASSFITFEIDTKDVWIRHYEIKVGP